MIIVSQDREDIINFDNVKMINREENRISVDANFGRDDFYCIAEYDTEERAEEVLAEIIKSYRDYRTAECDGYTNVLQETAVFDMPEE